MLCLLKETLSVKQRSIIDYFEKYPFEYFSADIYLTNQEQNPIFVAFPIGEFLFLLKSESWNYSGCLNSRHGLTISFLAPLPFGDGQTFSMINTELPESVYKTIFNLV